jgi:Polyketide cyclase / dehydrase and lipid transport
MTERQYFFQSSWLIPAGPTTVWQAMTDQPFSWDEWWPELRDLSIIKAAPGLSGTVFSCSWQAPVGYRLRTEVRIGKVVRHHIVTLHTAGDLQGTVTCRLSADGNNTRIDIDWQVVTKRRWMNLSALLLRPLFIRAHHAVMRSGEQGLCSYTARLH